MRKMTCLKDENDDKFSTSAPTNYQTELIDKIKANLPGQLADANVQCRLHRGGAFVAQATDPVRPG